MSDDAVKAKARARALAAAQALKAKADAEAAAKAPMAPATPVTPEPVPAPAPAVPEFTPPPDAPEVGGVGGYMADTGEPVVGPRPPPPQMPAVVPPGATMPSSPGAGLSSAGPGSLADEFGGAPRAYVAPLGAPDAPVTPEGATSQIGGPGDYQPEFGGLTSVQPSAVYDRLHHLSSGLWKQAADIAAVPPEVMKVVFGAAGSQIMQGVNPTEAFRNGLRKIGWMTPAEQEDTLDRIGYQIPLAMAELAAVFTGAGAVEKFTEGSTKAIPSAFNAVAKWLRSKPMGQVTGTMGAVAGGQVANEASDGNIAWTMLGTMLGAGGVATLLGTANVIGQRTLVPWYKSLTRPRAREAIVPLTAETGAGPVSARAAMANIEDALKSTHDDVMQGAQTRVNQALDVFQNVGSPDQEAGLFFKKMHEAADYARARVKTLLSFSKLDTKLPMDHVNGAMSRIRRARLGSLAMPDGEVRELIDSMNLTPKSPAGKAQPPPHTKVEGLVNLRDMITAKMNDMRWGQNTDKKFMAPLQASYKLLIDAIDADLQAGAPSPQVSAAIKIKQDLSRLFDSGPLGRIYRTDPNARPALIPAETLDEMQRGAAPTPAAAGETILSAPQSLDEIDRFYTAQAGPVVAPPADLGGFPRARLMPAPSGSVVEQATQVVASEFKKVLGSPEDMMEPGVLAGDTATLSPGKLGATVERGKTFMKKYETLVTGLGNAWARLRQPLDALGNSHVATKQYLASAVARAIGKDADVVIDDIFDPKTGSGVYKVRNLMRGVGHDPIAVQGLRFGIMQRFWKDVFGRTEVDRTGGQLSAAWSSRALTLLDNRSTRLIYQEALGTKTFNRLEAVVKAAISLNDAQRGMGHGLLRRAIPANFLIKSVASMLGAAAGRRLGTGTIQVPGKMSMLAQNIAGAFFKSALPANEMLSRALLDPRWEKLLLIRAPETVKEVESLNGVIRELFRAGRTTMRGATIQYNQPEEDQ